MNKLIKIFIAAVMAAICTIFLLNCNQPDEIIGTWNTRSIEKDGVRYEISDSFISFTTSDNLIQVYGNSGCNLYNGVAKARRGKIKFDNMGSTKMMGSPEEMQFEDMFLDCICNADKFNLTEGILTIESTEKNIVLKFSK